MTNARRKSGATPFDSRSGRRRVLSVAAPIALVLLAAAVAIQLVSPSTAASSTSLRVDVPDTARAGEPFYVSLWLNDASSVAGYEAMVLFDGEAATFRGVDHSNNELNRMGRDVQTIGPDEFPGGMAIGAYSCSFTHCVEIEGLPRQQRGGSGLVRLATFTIVPHVAGPLTLELGSPIFVDVDGSVLNVALDQLVFTIQVEEGE